MRLLDLSDVSLVVRAAPWLRQEGSDLKGKTLAEVKAALLALYMAIFCGTHELDDGTAVEAVVFGVSLDQTDAFVDAPQVGLFAFQQVARNSFADLAPDGVDPFVTASQNSDDASKTDFVIDIAAAAEALAGGGATQAQKIEVRAGGWSCVALVLSQQKMLMVRWRLMLLSERDSGNLADGQDGTVYSGNRYD